VFAEKDLVHLLKNVAYKKKDHSTKGQGIKVENQPVKVALVAKRVENETCC